MLSVSKIFILFVSILFIHSFSYAQVDWEYDSKYDVEKLYIHPIAQYAPNPSFMRLFDINKYNLNILYLNLGSVTDKQLMIKSFGHFKYARIDEYLSSALILENDETDHKNFNKFDYAFEFYFHKPVKRKAADKYLIFGIKPSLESEHIGLRYGVFWGNDEIDNYLRFVVDTDDIFYDKVTKDSKTEKQPIKLRYDFLFSIGELNFKSESTYDFGFKRKYSNNDLKEHRRKINDFLFKVNLFDSHFTFAEMYYKHYHFKEAKTFIQDSLDFVYRNDINELTGQLGLELSKSYSVKTTFNYIFQSSRAFNYKDYRYERTEKIPGFWITRHNNPSKYKNMYLISLGYIVSFYDWEYSDYKNPEDSYIKEDYIDKIVLKLSVEIPSKGFIELSAAQKVKETGFAGGNFQMVFSF